MLDLACKRAIRMDERGQAGLRKNPEKKRMGYFILKVYFEPPSVAFGFLLVRHVHVVSSGAHPFLQPPVL